MAVNGICPLKASWPRSAAEVGAQMSALIEISLRPRSAHR